MISIVEDCLMFPRCVTGTFLNHSLLSWSEGELGFSLSYVLNFCHYQGHQFLGGRGQVSRSRQDCPLEHASHSPCPRWWPRVGVMGRASCPATSTLSGIVQRGDELWCCRHSKESKGQGEKRNECNTTDPRQGLAGASGPASDPWPLHQQRGGRQGWPFSWKQRVSWADGSEGH